MSLKLDCRKKRVFVLTGNHQVVIFDYSNKNNIRPWKTFEGFKYGFSQNLIDYDYVSGQFLGISRQRKSVKIFQIQKKGYRTKCLIFKFNLMVMKSLKEDRITLIADEQKNIYVSNRLSNKLIETKDLNIDTDIGDIVNISTLKDNNFILFGTKGGYLLLMRFLKLEGMFENIRLYGNGVRTSSCVLKIPEKDRCVTSGKVRIQEIILI